MKAVLGCVCDFGLQTGRVRQADPCWAGKFRACWAGRLLQCTGLLPTSMMRDLIGRCNPETSLHTTAQESRQCRKAGHMRGAMETLEPGGLLRSLYRGCYVRAKDTADVGCPHK